MLDGPPVDGEAVTIRMLGLDGDDTLWHSETYFAVTEERFRTLLDPWLPGELVAERLLERERANLGVFGYGVKGFILSMIETAIEASEGRIPAASVQRIIDWGKEMHDHPVELLDGVAETLDSLTERYALLLITKGDLFHQETKVAASGLGELFSGIEIVSEKDAACYRRALGRYGVDPAEFVMVGNSVRSDVLPVLEIGARAVHIPYGITWGHEIAEADHVDGWWQLESLRGLPDLLASLSDRADGAGRTARTPAGG
jgi:putative hydrolase of the HAD superfamily